MGVKQGQQDGNYQYDAIGNLISDASEGIRNIEWSVYCKIRNITKNDGTNISYTYDAAGNRISKNANGKETWYPRYASGNVMSIYNKEASINGGDLTHTEIHLYGSGRLGIYNVTQNVQNLATNPTGINTFTRGKKFFELSNHLGNVLATVSDKKTGIDTNGDGIIDYYSAEVVTANDYYPFGMMMPGRKYKNVSLSGDEGYRYGFNGKELDKEMTGTTTYDYGFRIYNPGLGRFLRVDPLASKYPSLSPYCFVANNPIRYIDPDGREIVNPQGRRAIYYDKKGGMHFTKYATADIKRVANALSLTTEGATQLKRINQSDIKTKINISSDSKIEKKEDGTHYTYGGKEQGNINNPPTYSKCQNPDGSFGIKEATITIYEGTIAEGIKEGSGLEHEGLTMEQAIGAVAGHEGIHATDKGEINKDINAEFGTKAEKKAREKAREVKPEQVEKKIIEQSKKLKE